MINKNFKFIKYINLITLKLFEILYLFFVKYPAVSNINWYGFLPLNYPNVIKFNNSATPKFEV